MCVDPKKWPVKFIAVQIIARSDCLGLPGATSGNWNSWEYGIDTYKQRKNPPQYTGLGLRGGYLGLPLRLPRLPLTTGNHGYQGLELPEATSEATEAT